jgi:hypothetical protein
MTRILAFVGVLALLGCAGRPEWSKDGMSQQATARELSECQSIAREATQRDTNIMTDIMATRGGDWQRTGVMDTHVEAFSLEDRNRSGDIVNRCMIGKGFVPGGS